MRCSGTIMHILTNLVFKNINSQTTLNFPYNAFVPNQSLLDIICLDVKYYNNYLDF